MMDADHDARRANDLLLFIVSVATIIPLFDVEWSRLASDRNFWLTILILAGLYVYSWQRK